MPCYHPLNGYRARTVNKSGKRGIVFKATEGFTDMPVQLPCGRCVGCRLERSRQWAIRCVHEASLHAENMFITLTYNEKNLPYDGGLRKKHFQDFMKRYRKHLGQKKIRYYQCGEYGEKNLRPHYHAIIFGHEFNDKVLHSLTKNNDRLYTSDSLNRIWNNGYCLIGDVTFESAAYVARYIMKKINGEKSEKEKTYERVSEETGEVFNVLPEYTTMSRRPGIGKQWFEEYERETYRDDYIVSRGIKMQPPKYYDDMYEGIEKIKRNRKKRAQQKKYDNTPERLAVREKCKQVQVNRLKRNLSED